MTKLSKKVLLLNASYEAHRMISAKRAIKLILRGAAQMVEVAGSVRSERAELDLPSVVRLLHYIDFAGIRRREASRRTSIIARDRARCQYCGRKFQAAELTLDHIIPQSKGGLSTYENLVAACRPCNNRKANRTPEEAGMYLLKHPQTLNYMIDHQVMAHEAESRPEWRQYLFLEDSGMARAAGD